MGINDTLLDRIGKDIMSDYGLDCHEVKVFMCLKDDFCKRQEKAIEIIESIIRNRNKDIPFLNELAKFEHNARGIGSHLRDHRDHVVHALLSFILGIYIYENFLKRKIVTTDIDRYMDIELQWIIAAFFHDIGYPFAIGDHEDQKSYINIINNTKNKIDNIPGIDYKVNAPDINSKIVLSGLENLTDYHNSLDLIQRCLSSWKLSSIKVKEVYSKIIESGEISHGMISSLTALYIVDLLYQKNNPKRSRKLKNGWSQESFKKNIVPACSAIFIHDLPKECFSKDKISPTQATIAFLLRLSDCLQDWDRPSKNNTTGFPDDHQYDIDISGKRLIFKVKNPEQKCKIFNDIHRSLDDSQIDIVDLT